MDAIKRWADTVHSITPSIPVPNMPYAHQAAQARRVVASAVPLRVELLASQRHFAEGMLEAAKPLTPGKSATMPPKAGTAAK